MLIFTNSLRVCLAAHPIDLRKGFDGLAAIVEHQLAESTTSSQVFVFTNKRRDRIRLLYWDGSGLWVMTKRLEKGTFAWPTISPDTTKIHLKAEALELLLNGIDLKATQHRPWYQAPSGG